MSQKISVFRSWKRGFMTIMVFVTTCLLLYGPASIKPISAAVNFDPISTPLSLDNELYVTDGWVIKEGSTYKMWYSHGKMTLGLPDLALGLSDAFSAAVLSDIFHLDFVNLLDDLAGGGINVNQLYSLLNATSSVIGYATSSDGINWNVDGDDSEVLAESGAAWDSIMTPCVINDSGTYKMWYTHTTTNLSEGLFQGYIDDLDSGDPATRLAAVMALLNAFSSEIGYATSPDGIIWTAGDTDLTAGSGLWESLATPSVIKDGSTYKMWYSRSLTDITETDISNYLDNLGTFGSDQIWDILDGTTMVIGYAESIDGTTWIVQNDTILQGVTQSIFNSVTAPCVIKNGTTYEMFYTNMTSDLTLPSFQALIAAIQALDLNPLWAELQADDFNDFLALFVDLVDNQLTDVKAELDSTYSQIGYATSSDGTIWNVADDAIYTGSTTELWNSVALPRAILDNGVYEMWFSHGFTPLTAQGIVELLEGTFLPINYTQGTYTASLDLVTSWNFIGLPLEPDSTAIEAVLVDIIEDVEIIWHYEGATETWTYFIPDGPATLTELIDGKGYWIELNDNATLTISGNEPALPYNIDLAIGWNLISLPMTPSLPDIELVLADIIEDVEIVWHYEGATETWTYFIPDGPATLTELTEGNAYWIEMTSPDNILTFS